MPSVVGLEDAVVVVDGEEVLSCTFCRRSTGLL